MAVFTLFLTFYIACYATGFTVGLALACYIAGFATPLIIAIVVARRNGVPL